MTGKIMGHRRRIEPMQCPRITLEQHPMPVRLDDVAPARTALHWGPVIRLADQDQGIRLESRWRCFTAGIEGYSRQKRMRLRWPHQACKHRLQDRPTAMRKADHTDPLGPDIGARAEIFRGVECVLSLQLRRDRHAVIAYCCDPARAKTVD